jgi:hypothetical protein
MPQVLLCIIPTVSRQHDKILAGVGTGSGCHRCSTPALPWQARNGMRGCSHPIMVA